MKRGRSKAKGSSFERQICKALSHWLSKGKSTDLFWRTSLSGGRATVQHRKGVKVRQAGDICAVSPEGHAFTEIWYCECKHIKNMNLSGFLIANQGPLSVFWPVACREAEKHGLQPMIIIRSRGPILVITKPQALERYTAPQIYSPARNCDVSLFSDMILHDMPVVRRHRKIAS